MKRPTLTAVTLIALLVLAALPAAAKRQKLTSTITWELLPDGTLMIEGTGEMPNFEYNKPKYWRTSKYEGKIKRLVIGEGITSVGNCNFRSAGLYKGNTMYSLKTVKLPESLTSVGPAAFETSCIEKIEFGSGLKDIWHSAFAWTNLREVKLPEGLTTIWPGAFSHNPDLECVDFSDAHVEICINAFSEDPKLCRLKNAANIVYDTCKGSKPAEFANVFDGTALTPALTSANEKVDPVNPVLPKSAADNFDFNGEWFNESSFSDDTDTYTTTASLTLRLLGEPVELDGRKYIGVMSGYDSDAMGEYTETEYILLADVSGNDADITYTHLATGETWLATLSYSPESRELTLHDARMIQKGPYSASDDSPATDDMPKYMFVENMTLNRVSPSAPGEPTPDNSVAKTRYATYYTQEIKEEPDETFAYDTYLRMLSADGKTDREVMNIVSRIDDAWVTPDGNGLALVTWDGGTDLQELTLFVIDGLGTVRTITSVNGMTAHPIYIDIDLNDPKVRSDLEKSIPSITREGNRIKVYDPHYEQTVYYDMYGNLMP